MLTPCHMMLSFGDGSRHFTAKFSCTEMHLRSNLMDLIGPLVPQSHHKALLNNGSHVTKQDLKVTSALNMHAACKAYEITC